MDDARKVRDRLKILVEGGLFDTCQEWRSGCSASLNAIRQLLLQAVAFQRLGDFIQRVRVLDGCGQRPRLVIRDFLHGATQDLAGPCLG